MLLLTFFLTGNLFQDSLFLGNTTFSNSIKTEAATKISISKKTKTLFVNGTYKLKIKGTKKKVTWKSNKTSVATVSSSGLVTGIHTGTATITATVSSKKYTCKITVKEQTVSGYAATTLKASSLDTMPANKITVQLLNIYTGSTANSLAKAASTSNPVPTTGQQYILLKLKITYLSGQNNFLFLDDIFHPNNDFFQTNQSTKLKVLSLPSFETGTYANKSYSGFMLKKGGSGIAIVGALTTYTGTNITYRIPLNSTNSIWFTTKK